MIEVHGISNCDTVKKALKWLQDNQLPHQFRDVRQQPLTATEVRQWLQHLEPSQLLNKRSTSYRQLSDNDKQITEPQQLAELIAQQPTLFKRPLVKDNSGIHTGFKAETWQQRYLTS